MKTQTQGTDSSYTYTRSSPRHPWKNGPMKLIGQHPHDPRQWDRFYTTVRQEILTGNTKTSWRPGVKAFMAYFNARNNGAKEDYPRREFPLDGKWVMTSPDATSSTTTYIQGPQDRLWMEECDHAYITRLAREGKLLAVEPNADKEIVADHKFRKEITEALAQVKIEGTHAAEAVAVSFFSPRGEPAPEPQPDQPAGAMEGLSI